MSAWLALLAAGLLEVAWALGLKYSDGFTRFWPSALTLMAIALSFGLMALALRSLPFGTAYAVWTGIGAAGSIIVGLIDNFGKALVPELSYFTLFAPMVIVLAIKPTGLYGRA